MSAAFVFRFSISFSVSAHKHFQSSEFARATSSRSFSSLFFIPIYFTANIFLFYAFETVVLLCDFRSFHNYLCAAFIFKFYLFLAPPTVMRPQLDMLYKYIYIYLSLSRGVASVKLLCIVDQLKVLSGNLRLTGVFFMLTSTTLTLIQSVRISPKDTKHLHKGYSADER